MRALVLVLAAVLLVPAGAGAQQAWVKAYEDGVELFEKGGNDALAEQKLVEAREKGPKQARRHNYSSVVFRPFIPDFYLGLIYVRTGRLKQGQDLIERALRDQLVKPDDKTFALAQASLQRARDEQTRLASNATTRPNPPDVVKPPVTTAPPPTANTSVTPTNTINSVTPPPVRPNPPANTEPTWLAAYRGSMEAARASLRQSRYAEARTNLASAANLAGDNARRQEAALLGREIETAQNIESQRVVDRARAAIGTKNVDAAVAQVVALEALAPQHAALPELRTSIERLRGALRGTADLVNVERLGVKLFLSGQYKESAAQLERAVGSGVRSPRIYLFLASSRAAQALLAPASDKPKLVEEARRLYALAKPGAGTLTADQRFISPTILELLRGS